VGSLDDLDPRRRANAPHPLDIANRKKRSDLIEFLRELGTQPMQR